MFNEIYLDNNATTKVDERVLEAMLPYLKTDYGNPSSVYNFSKEVNKAVNHSRELVASLLNASSEEIIFTSCATESNNTAIMSAIRTNPNKKHLITTKLEHSSILETMSYLENIGYQVTYLSVDCFGRLDLKELKNSIRDDTLLISVMFANNEVGNILPIPEIGHIAKEHNILFHVDAVQAVGKVKIDVKDMNIDMLSLSGHKIHAPKGVGILYKKKDIPFVPLIFGGHQENGLRGGTENVPYIVALGKAIELILDDHFESNKEILRLRDYLELEIKKNIEGVIVYGDEESKLPNTLNIAFDHIRGEELQIMLDQFHISVSTGSACNSHEAAPSHVLVAMNANLESSSPIRISLSKYTTKEEIDMFLKRLINVVTTLRKRD